MRGVDRRPERLDRLAADRQPDEAGIATASPQRARRSAEVWTPPKEVAG
jgi:hypothetical protein